MKTPRSARLRALLLRVLTVALLSLHSASADPSLNEDPPLDPSFTSTPVLESVGQQMGAYAETSFSVSGNIAVSGPTIFVRQDSAWVEQQTLPAPARNPVFDDYQLTPQFGNSVAIAGDIIVVGDRELTNDALGLTDSSPSEEIFWICMEALGVFDASSFGAAYVFRRVGEEWILEQKLQPADLPSFQGGFAGFFGETVAVDRAGERVLVRCKWQANGPASVTDVVYVFARGENGWTQEAKLPFKGQTIIQENRIVQLEPIHHPYRTAVVHTFERSDGTWVQQASLDLGDRYAAAGIALAGDTMAAGGHDFTDVFIRREGTWVHQQTLVHRWNFIHSGVPGAVALNLGGNMLAIGTGEIFTKVGDIWGPQQDVADPSAGQAGVGWRAAVFQDEGLFVFSDFYGWVFHEGIPTILDMTPGSTMSGSGPVTLTLEGAFFSERSVVQWKTPQIEAAAALDTTLLDGMKLTATVPASLVPPTNDLYPALVSVRNPSSTPEGRVSPAEVFLVTAANVALAESSVVDLGQSTMVTVAPVASGTAEVTNSSGITAVLTNVGGAEPVTVAAAIYSSNPAPENSAFAIESAAAVTGEFMDLQVTGADEADTLTAYFYYPTSAVESEDSPVLKYFDGAAQQWIPVKTAGNLAPAKDTADNLDGTLSGGRFTVQFDQSSTPKLTELGGTFFAIAIPRPALDFIGFLAPIGGADATGGTFADPVRTFKAGSTIPVKFTAGRDGSPLLTGTHTLHAAKYSNETTAEAPIDATPQGKATTGNQFVLRDGEWHFNLDTKAAGMSKGIWKLTATLSDNTTHYVWIQVK